ncbi:MAG: hypothetical protein HIU86_06240 [Acidobacteria bacterium]|nr:hypothetical protein [Acidobacteriota bacterium]
MSAGEIVRNLVIAAFVAALVGGAAVVLGLDGPHAIALGGGVLALVLGLLAQRSVVPSTDLAPSDLEAPDPEPVVAGRRDLDQLAWSMVEHRTRIRGIVLARVRAIATHRLAHHGLDPGRAEDAAAIEALLGPAAAEVLRSDLDRPVTPRALDATLHALDRLPPPAPLGPVRAVSSDRTSRAD